MDGSTRRNRHKALTSLLALGILFLWAGWTLAEPPLGIQGEVTVTNDDTDPVPVTIQGGAAREAVLLQIQNGNTNFAGSKDLELQLT